jgi:hypothetical protein
MQKNLARSSERALVRLRAHMNSRVKVPAKQNAFQLVTEGNCVAVRRGGEQPEVNEKPVG